MLQCIAMLYEGQRNAQALCFLNGFPEVISHGLMKLRATMNRNDDGNIGFPFIPQVDITGFAYLVIRNDSLLCFANEIHFFSLSAGNADSVMEKLISVILVFQVLASNVKHSQFPIHRKTISLNLYRNYI